MRYATNLLILFASGHNVFVLADAGIFLVEVVLAVRVNAGRNLLGLIFKRPALFLVELIAEGISPDSPAFSARLDAKLFESLREMEFLVGGFDFSRIIGEYYRSTQRGDDIRAASCLRWLRGEFSTKSEARRELGFDVSTIIGDNNWYDFLKLWASLSK